MFTTVCGLVKAISVIDEDDNKTSEKENKSSKTSFSNFRENASDPLLREVKRLENFKKCKTC